jgi:hypothetical protein
MLEMFHYQDGHRIPKGFNLAFVTAYVDDPDAGVCRVYLGRDEEESHTLEGWWRAAFLTRVQAPHAHRPDDVHYW